MSGGDPLNWQNWLANRVVAPVLVAAIVATFATFAASVTTYMQVQQLVRQSYASKQYVDNKVNHARDTLGGRLDVVEAQATRNAQDIQHQWRTHPSAWVPPLQWPPGSHPQVARFAIKGKGRLRPRG